MSTIPIKQHCVISWRCVLCDKELQLSEKDASSVLTPVNYTCSCGRLYHISFQGGCSVTEDTSIDRIFHVRINGPLVKIRLAWDWNKGCCVHKATVKDWEDVVALCIGKCWQEYSAEIIEHIKGEVI